MFPNAVTALLPRARNPVRYLGAFLVLVMLVVQTFDLGQDVLSQGFTGAWTSWVNNQQWFFHIGIVWGLIAIGVRRPGLGWLSWGALLAFFVSSHGLIDQSLHQWFVAHGVYSAFGVPSWSMNPQFSKLLFYVVEIPVLLIWCVWSKTRTLQRGFLLMQTMAILVTTVAFHLALPAGAMNDYRQERVVDVRNALRSNDEHDFQVACQVLGLICRTTLSSDDTSIMPEVLKGLTGLRAYANEKARAGHPMQSPVVVNQGSLNSTNEFVAYVAGGFRRSDGTFWAAVDQDRVNLTWKNTEAYFSFLGWVAHGFWTLFVGFLIVFHDRRFKRRALNRLAERQILLARAHAAGTPSKGVDHGPL